MYLFGADNHISWKSSFENLVPLFTLLTLLQQTDENNVELKSCQSILIQVVDVNSLISVLLLKIGQRNTML